MSARAVEDYLSRLSAALSAQGHSRGHVERVVEELREHLRDGLSEPGADEARVLARLGPLERVARSFKPAAEELRPRLRLLGRAVLAKMRSSRMKRQLLVAASLAALLGLAFGVFASETARLRELDARLSRSQQELKRLEYVFHRDRELRRKCLSLAGADEAGLCDSADVDSLDPLVASSPPSWFPLFQRSAAEQKRRELSAAQVTIARGLAVESRLPVLERRIASLQRN